MTKKESWYDLNTRMSDEKEKAIFDEIAYLKSVYGLDKNHIHNVYKFYYMNTSCAVGTITKTALFISKVLKCYGYSDEDVTKFFFRNRSIFIASYADFRCRLALFNHFGLMDEALFVHNGILTYSFDTVYNMGTRSLYAIMNSVKFDSVEELKDKIRRLDRDFIIELKKSNELDQDKRISLDDELIKKLKVMKARNQYKLKREIR